MCATQSTVIATKKSLNSLTLFYFGQTSTELTSGVHQSVSLDSPVHFSPCSLIIHPETFTVVRKKIIKINTLIKFICFVYVLYQIIPQITMSMSQRAGIRANKEIDANERQ